MGLGSCTRNDGQTRRWWSCCWWQKTFLWI